MRAPTPRMVWCGLSDILAPVLTSHQNGTPDQFHGGGARPSPGGTDMCSGSDMAGSRDSSPRSCCSEQWNSFTIRQPTVRQDRAGGGCAAPGTRSPGVVRAAAGKGAGEPGDSDWHDECPDIRAPDNGGIAVVGRDPASACRPAAARGCAPGPGGRSAAIPGTVPAAAKADIPDARSPVPARRPGQGGRLTREDHRRDFRERGAAVRDRDPRKAERRRCARCGAGDRGRRNRRNPRLTGTSA